MTKLNSNKQLFEIGKMYQNIEQEVAWPFYLFKNDRFSVVAEKYLDPSNTFVVVEYIDNPGCCVWGSPVWDSYKILFEDGNLYYLMFSKVSLIDYRKSFSIVIVNSCDKR